MKKLMIFALLVMSLNVYAESIKCYSSTKKILDSEGDQVEYYSESNAISFIEKKTYNTIYIFNPDCVIKVVPNN